MNLTKKELFAVEELAKGYMQREIAERQHRSLGVIKKHIQHAMQKMQARNSVHLVAICKDLGLISVLFCVLAVSFSAIDVEMRRGRLTRAFSTRGGRVQQDEV